MDPFVAGLQRTLTGLGFPCPVDGLNGPLTRTAVARFQLAYNLGRHLAVDGQYGPLTMAALAQVQQSGRLSPNFAVGELRSKGDGTVWVHRDLLVALERLRAAVGRPLPIVSAWRDVAHNRRVGGATSSQHTFGAAPELRAIAGRLAPGAHLHTGRAADFNRGYVSLDAARQLQLFTGLGHRAGQVTHVDVRVPGNVTAPTVWLYG